MIGFATANAQSKVGHINIEELISVMPAAIQMENDLKRIKNTYDNDLNALDAKFKAKAEKYQKEGPTQTQEVNQQRALELQQDQEALYKELQKAEADFVKQRNDRLAPIIDKAKKAIQDVAKEQGYQYVLDRSTLIVAQGTDLLPLVKSKLGI